MIIKKYLIAQMRAAKDREVKKRDRYIKMKGYRDICKFHSSLVSYYDTLLRLAEG